MPYEELLKRGLKKVPKKAEASERFVIPKARVQPAGARTIIVNFQDIAKDLRREPGHFLKFLLKELATKGDVEKGRLTVIGRFPAEQVDKKIEAYVKEYVVCPECGKPDTKIVKEDRFMFLVCEACGAKHSLGMRI
jgi:translation initiation factor 2 subunit 2